jgi:hypothetical protein
MKVVKNMLNSLKSGYSRDAGAGLADRTMEKKNGSSHFGFYTCFAGKSTVNLTACWLLLNPAEEHEVTKVHWPVVKHSKFGILYY